MKTLIIKLTDSCYEKVMRYEVEAPTQIIESIRQGKDAIEEFMKHYRQGRKEQFKKGGSCSHSIQTRRIR